MLFTPGASFLREHVDEDELYEKNLGAADPPQREFEPREVSSDSDNDDDDDDDEDERYERDIVYAEEEILGARLPKFFNEESEKKDEESEMKKEKIEYMPPIEKEIQKKLSTVEGGKGGGGFIVYTKGDVIFSEIAWMGGAESPNHEWIELKNMTNEEVLLSGFSLARGDGTLLIGESGDKFNLAHRIAPGGYFLLERNEEATPLLADKLYDGSLSNTGEVLILRDGADNEIDRIDMGSGWEAGSNEIGKEGYKPTMSNFGSQTWKDGIPTPRRDNEALPTIPPPLSHEPGIIIISEIAWMGDKRNSQNEWIELHNTASSTINLFGWMLLAEDGTPSISLSGVMLPEGYFLLERSDDDAAAGIAADLIYTGALGNEGETLTLKDPAGNEIDTVNGWLAGDNETKKTMQKEGEFWFSALPTPKAQNKRDVVSEVSLLPAATSTEKIIGYQFHDVVINEIAWMGTNASANDEWIELRNTSPKDISLSGWKFLFAKNASSTPDGEIAFEDGDMLSAGGFLLLKRNASSTVQHVSGKVYMGNQMNNSGEYLSIVDDRGNIIDEVDGALSGWPAGGNKTSPEIKRASMERSGDFTAWYTFDNMKSLFNGEIIIDAKGNPVLGTPGCPNSKELDTCAV